MSYIEKVAYTIPSNYEARLCAIVVSRPQSVLRRCWQGIHNTIDQGHLLLATRETLGYAMVAAKNTDATHLHNDRIHVKVCVELAVAHATRAAKIGLMVDVQALRSEIETIRAMLRSRGVDIC